MGDVGRDEEGGTSKKREGEGEGEEEEVREFY